ncbi:hypothetical protein SAMN04244572_00501 [Azotobacter beijerinckii]|uniref:Uncharacterized protein n=1 Tax=Azotobacter beijerinckii TaxID=170623 RepID=A0A1H6RA19_9GAMM|nr:hypothetical protein [Azotobacter beijerinckii]SEI48455.1 hypothetical protein SAMN04244572_00501 [Azotobacter beijerinckii]
MPAKKKPTTKGRPGKKSRLDDISKHLEQALTSGANAVVSCSDDPWMVSDRKFFEANPSRSYRLRRVIQGELATMRHVTQGEFAGSPTHVLVQQVAPGFRSRQFLNCEGFPDGIAGWDTLLALLWSAMREGRPFDLMGLIERARVIDHAAGKGRQQ